MKAFIATTLGLAIACCTFVACNAGSVSELKGAIEGVYIVDEWNSDGKTFRPPQVEGRVVYLNGVVVAILIDTMQEAKKTYGASFGSYTLTADSFAYKFDTRTVFTQTPDKIDLSRAIPWEGMREFTVKQDGDSVRLQYGEKAEFLFNPTGFTYSEGGKILRVYHRAKQE
jgi:hypothetical protein